MREVVVTTGARLHFGLMMPEPGAARQFGGVGVMIDQPGFEVKIRRAEETCVEAPDEVRQRVLTFFERWAAADPEHQPVSVSVTRQIQSHGGMGSGTQLALAVGRGLAELGGQNVASQEIAVRMQRGARSAIGIHGFDRGGFIIDGGKSAAESVGNIQNRLAWPDQWPFVLITLKQSAGLSGEAEIEAFRVLQPMSGELVNQLESIVVKQMQPALLAQDHTAFCQSLDRYGDLVGDYFAPAQGGRYADQRVRDLVKALRQQGVVGVAQSSWGPTVCVVCCDQQHAEQIVQRIQDTQFEGDTQIVNGLNTGADVRVNDSLDA